MCVYPRMVKRNRAGCKNPALGVTCVRLSLRLHCFVVPTSHICLPCGIPDNGVLTFQRLVGDFILSDSGAVENGYNVAESSVSFSPFPTFAYVESGFFGDIGGEFFESDCIRIFIVCLRSWHLTASCTFLNNYFRNAGPLGRTWSALSSRSNDFLYHARKGARPKRIDENDECCGIRYRMVVVCVFPIVQHRHSYHRIGSIHGAVCKVRRSPSLDVLDSLFFGSHGILHVPCNTYVKNNKGSGGRATDVSTSIWQALGVVCLYLVF